ncbi:hypothetical protein EV589_5927 [Mycobacterium sp. BK558]|nr:hypothetical protein EV589_5927 [Mycobacterium sp. BK558]
MPAGGAGGGAGGGAPAAAGATCRGCKSELNGGSGPAGAAAGGIIGAPIDPICPAGTPDVAGPGEATCAGPPAADTGAGPAPTGEVDAPVVELRGCAGCGATGGGNTDPVPKPALKPREKSDGVAAPGAPPPPVAADGRPPAAGDTDDGNEDDNPAFEDSELGDRPPLPAEDNPPADGGLNPLPRPPSGDDPPPPLPVIAGGAAVVMAFGELNDSGRPSARGPFLSGSIAPSPGAPAPSFPEEPDSPWLGGVPSPGLPLASAPGLLSGRSAPGVPSEPLKCSGRSLGAEGVVPPDPVGLSRAWTLSPLPPVCVVWSAGVTWPPPGI